jgi:hypothetical protein
MMLKSVTEGKTLLLAGVLALVAQGAWSDESNDAKAPAAAGTATETSDRPALEIDISAYIEALNKRLSEQLQRDIEALNAARVELAIAEVPTRG